MAVGLALLVAAVWLGAGAVWGAVSLGVVGAVVLTRGVIQAVHDARP